MHRFYHNFDPSTIASDSDDDIAPVFTRPARSKRVKTTRPAAQTTSSPSQTSFAPAQASQRSAAPRTSAPVAAMAPSYGDEIDTYTKYIGETGAEQFGGRREELRNAPLVSLSVKHKVDPTAEDLRIGAYNLYADNDVDMMAVESTADGDDFDSKEAAFPSTHLLGFSPREQPGLRNLEPIMHNTSAPSLAFICGSQGSGKSYTFTCMLENGLLPTTAPGTGSSPLAGLVFHYDNNGSTALAEATSLAHSGVKVRVLASERLLRSQEGLQSGIWRCDRSLAAAFPRSGLLLRALIDAHVGGRERP